MAGSTLVLALASTKVAALALIPLEIMSVVVFHHVLLRKSAKFRARRTSLDDIELGHHSSGLYWYKS